MYKILIIGAGKRVINDILPCLIASGYEEEEIVIWRIKEEIIPKYPRLEVITGFETISKIRFQKELIIICCAPAKEQFKTLSQISQYINPSIVLLDTPVTYFYSQNESNNQRFKNVHVLEDSMLIPFLGLNTGQRYPFITYVKKAFYEYHGYALLEKYFNDEIEPLLVINKINLRILKTKSRNNFIIWIGKRDYENGSAKFMSSCSKEYCHKRLDSDFDQISKNILEEYVLGGIKFSDVCQNPIKYMSAWKRIGLYQGFLLLRGHKIGFPEIIKIARIEKYSKKRLFIKYFVNM